jgi:hypothetical protein
MKTEKTHLLHRITLLVVLLLVAFSTTGCEFVISQAETDGELPEDPEDCTINPDLCASNPNDPDNPGFELPAIMLSNGLSFNAPFEVHSNQVTLGWTIIAADSTPVSFDYTFSYRIASPAEDINNVDFIDIGSDKSMTLSGLNETFNNELYTFEIKAIYAENSEKQTTFTGQFSVNAFQDRGFFIQPS